MCKNILTPPSLDSIVDNATPFRYCSDAECGEFYCPLPNNNILYLHPYMSIAYQNALITYVRQIAALFKPNCPEEGYSARVGNIYFKSCKVNESINCSSGSQVSCYNTELRLHIEYFCCQIL